MNKKQTPLILIVDDEKNLRELLARLLANEGYQCLTAANGVAGQKILQEEAVDALILDLKMPGMDGLELLSWLREAGPEIPAVMMSAFGEVQDAVSAMKRGADDYLVKPFDPDELLLRLKKLLTSYSDKRIHQTSRESSTWEKNSPPPGKAMAEAERLIQRAAPTPSTVLITGESGTGKEVAAQRIHQLSQRREGPFIPVNLGGIPETLLESELFGYEKGAFTGADKRKSGYFERATGGTLFLDEIGEMPLSLQVKLLRALQERKIQRLGGQNPIPVDVRILAATNRDLEDQVRKGLFREDLFYRLNVIRVAIPPLRERTDEIPDLVNHFISQFRTRLNRPIQGIREDALQLLRSYPFPGNIRELENIIERAVILCEGNHIIPEDLALPSTRAMENRSPMETSPPADQSQSSLRDLEKKAIQQALYRNEGKKQITADELGISRRTLLNKIKEFQLED